MSGSAKTVNHFLTLFWKSYILELDNRRTFTISLISTLAMGFFTGVFGSAFQQNYAMVFAVYVMTTVKAAVLTRSIGLNLIRDRKTKFRLTLQLVGVDQLPYIASSICFSWVLGMAQLVVMMVGTYLGSVLLGQSSGPCWLNAGQWLPEYYLGISFFLFSGIALAATISAFIRQYDFSGEVIAKLGFMIYIMPLVYTFARFINSISIRDENYLQKIIAIEWPTVWLPSMVFLQIGLKRAVMLWNQIPGAPGFEMNPPSTPVFLGVLVAQFIGYTAVYLLLDTFVSNDTGIRRKVLSSAASQNIEHENLSQNIGEGISSSENRAPMIDKGASSARKNTLSIRQLVKCFGDFRALKGVDLEIESGGITALLGHNGAGKTTMIDIITGFQSATSGGVYLNGKNIQANEAILYGQVGYASSHDPLFEEIRVRDYLTLIAKLKCIANPVMEAARVAKEFQLIEHCDKQVKNCSGGTKRRLVIASALVGDPALIFLDEPSTGVDPENRRALWEALRNLQKPNRVLLMTTHHLEEAEYLSNDVIILSKGEVCVRGTPDNIKTQLGVGFKVILSNVYNRESEIAQALSHQAEHLKLDNSRYATLGELVIEMKADTNLALIDILRTLDSKQIGYSLIAATLEDAFISIDERERDTEQERVREAIIQRIFQKKFSREVSSKILALFGRKLDLLFRSLIQIVIIIMLAIIPAVVYYAILSISLTDTSFTVQINIIAALNSICMLYYMFACSFFGLTPVIERVQRIRYLMKMNKVDYKYYILTLFIPDVLISAIICICCFGFAYLFTSSFYSNFDVNVFLIMGAALILWMATFIVHSYCLSYLFKTKETSYKYLCVVYVALNMLGQAVAGILVNNDVGTEEQILDVFGIFMPVLAQSNLISKMLQSDDTYQYAELKPLIYKTLLCIFIFLPLAVVLDWWHNRIQVESIDMFRVQQNNDQAFDPATVNAERHNASQTNPNIPLQLREVWKRFGTDFFALSGVSFSLRPSEILGLIGPNGAGKSTLFNIVSNYMGPTSGQILYEGETLDSKPDFYSNTGLCAQDDIIWPDLTVDQHLKFYARIKGIDQDTIQSWKILMGLESFAGFSAINLSTGMKRKLCYIISMMSNPHYKFLDEPTSGLDPVSRKLMRQLILAQKKIYGGSCVFTTHTMKDAEDLCDRIAILINGKMATIDTVNNLRLKCGGYNVSFFKDLGDEEHKQITKIDEIYRKLFPECIINNNPIVTENTSRRVVFDAVGLNDLPGKIAALEQLKSQGEIRGFEISQRSLEDLFLHLARLQVARVQGH